MRPRMMDLVMVLLIGLLAGCGAAGTGPTTAPTVPPAPAVTITPAPGKVTTPLPGGTAVTNPTVQAAIADLARERGVDPAAIRVVAVEEVEWPNTALGCPEPGRAYAQVITPGYRITLEVNGDTVVYHGDRTGQVVSCP